jgi:hypothetical protein
MAAPDPEPAAPATILEWLNEGIARGWVVGDPFCGAHDGAGGYTEAEMAEADALDDDLLDRCVTLVRLEVPQ